MDANFNISDLFSEYYVRGSEIVKIRKELSGRIVTEIADTDNESVKNMLISMGWTPPHTPKPIKDHQIRELVNQVTAIALEYHAHQSLRERISQAIVPCLQQNNLAQQDKQDKQDKQDALRWRTISKLFNQCTTSRSERILEALTLDPERACDPLEDIIDAVLYTNPSQTKRST